MRRTTVGEAYLALRAPHMGRGQGAGATITHVIDGWGSGRDRVDGWGTLRWPSADGATRATMGLRVEGDPDAAGGLWLRFRWWAAPAGPTLGARAPEARECRVRMALAGLAFGRRWWLVCPRCGRRRGALYLPNSHHGEWRCSACWRLGYHS